MKNNIVKYIFFIFVIIIFMVSIIKINIEGSKEKDTSNSDLESSNKEINKEMKLAIANFDTINPILSSNQDVQDISKILYEPLIALTQDYQLEPCLATQWAKIDNTTYILKLRENVLWSNGEKFTGDDVLYTIDKLKETNSIYSSNVQYVVRVDVVDEFTIKIILQKDIPFFEYNLTFPIINKSDVEEKDTPVSTGMFKISNIQETNIVLEKNENYWNKQENDAILEKIEINLNPSKANNYSSFKLGNIDLLSTTNLDYENYIGAMGYSYKEVVGRNHSFIALNTENSVLSKLEVRQAISYAIDKNSIINNVFNGKYYTADFPLNYGSWLDSNNILESVYSLEKAQKILQENGWNYVNGNWQKEGTYLNRINFLVKESESNKVEIANNIKEQLEKAGINVTVNSVNDNTYNECIENKEYDLALCETTVSANPDLSRYFGADNMANYTNEEINQILEQVENTTDENILKEKYERLKQIYIEDVPYISLCFNKVTVAYNSKLVGDVAPNWFNLFYNIDKWYLTISR